MPSGDDTDPVAHEQACIGLLYGLLDQARDRARQALARTHASGGQGGTFQARVEREVTAAEQARRLAQLDGVEDGLCFGRIDLAPGGNGERGLYIGRIGLRDDQHEPKLIDWRAPAARPFYAATPKDPHGLIRRRHIYTRHRIVTGVDDEVFDLDQLSEQDRRSLSGEAMLIASINKARTGRMSDVVATIQAEQDRVIRAGLQGVLVVQGGPGTGKTVAALHRAAYLLYAHRRTLERRGVLIIGPNAVFLRYISQVLPALGETDVVLTSVAEMFPGVKASMEEEQETAVIKGSLAMARILRQAVRNQQRAPRGDFEVTVDDVTLTIPRDTCVTIRDRARSVRKAHNGARTLFVTDMLTALARAEAAALDRPLDPADIPYVRSRLWDEPAVRIAIDALWPPLTPQRLVGGLLTDADLLRRAAPDLTQSQRRLLQRRDPGAWTVADVPLLDEAAHLLGTDDSAERTRRRAAERERRAEQAYAREVLQMTGVAELGMLDASTLASWHRDEGVPLTTAERAWADPSWAYGHVIVDEAQELTEMAWRMVMRRIPARSLTIVGDLAQRGNPAGATTWEQVLDPYVKGRWRAESLSVNYRTPAEIMALAARVLAVIAPGERAPESVREEGVPPRAVKVASLRAEIGGVVAGEVAGMTGTGRLAVIGPGCRIAELAAALPGAARGDSPEALDQRVALLTAGQAKGLEFDRVVLADPGGIMAQSPVGGHDLYVAITRATHRLTIVHEADLPALLAEAFPRHEHGHERAARPVTASLRGHQ